MVNYYETATIRTTRSGKRWVEYRYWEDFGRETGYAHSWGVREKSGYGRIWVRPGENIRDAVYRRNSAFSD